MKKSKKKCQQIHAQRRFLERFGITFTQHMRDTFIYQIHNNKTKSIKRESHRKSRCVVEYDGQEYTVIYDRFRSEIVTVLTNKKNEEINICQ